MDFWGNLGGFMRSYEKGSYEIRDIMGEENRDIEKVMEENGCSPKDFTEIALKHRLRRVQKYNELWGSMEMAITPFELEHKMFESPYLLIELSTPTHHLRLKVSKI